MKIDAHVHFWQFGHNENMWIAENIAALQRDFTPNMLRPLCQKAGIEGVVLVQASPSNSETQSMLQLAANDPFILGVVGWVNLEHSEAELDATLNRLHLNPLLKGIRAHPPRQFDSKWLQDPIVVCGYRRLIQHRIPCDFIVNCTQLTQTLSVLNQLPGLTAIIDHGGRPFVYTGRPGAWETDIREIARRTDAYIKVSGLVERAGVEWTTDTLRPWIEILLDAFGASRLMFASNWPVVTLMGTYERWWSSINEVVDKLGLDEAEHERLFGGTAAQVYKIETP